MPPKALFDGSHRPDKLIMPSCDPCNRGTSTADLVASIISRWTYGQSSPDHPRLVKSIRSNHPDLIEEWTKLDWIGKMRARLHLMQHGIAVPADAGVATIGPLTIKLLNLFAHKVVLALYFEHFRTHLPDVGGISAYWRSKEDFAKDGIPNELLKLMQRYGTLEQGKWNTREIFEYRYELNESEGLFACLARLRGGLYIVGFATADRSATRDEFNDWLKPTDLLSILENPRYEKRA